ncbi:T9SS type A sorting domain-containing protein [Fulvivirga lutea]|uniref:T9SS type A sorting domain-containing protein n=1 Tax=Fulvivirga lutea TaxID=2810512 RepID=A0A974WG87_9BACT|nr:T9SS type A sorting domain-containing protein [Fulvivirga lutea]QSE97485.1 T9SS type A sorting domain-containing protein [Fulvivirga lutea]
MKKYFLVFVMSFLAEIAIGQTCTSLNNVISGNPKGWSRTTNWSCSGASNTVSGAWDGTNIVINRDFNIENEVIDLTSSTSITTITITSTGILTFSSNAKLLLPAGVEIVFESGAQLVANNNASGSLIEINGNGVWGNACPGCSNETLTGPGTIDENSDPNAPLPIELAFFNAKSNRNYIELAWSTYTEINNDFFTVEKSSDGINYSLLTTVDGAGNSLAPLEYSYTDKNPSFGRSYYRLKQTDFDGTSETFAPVAVDFTSLEEGKLVFTNPVSPGGLVNIITNAEETEALSLSVVNILGEVILTKTFSGSQYDFNLHQNMKPGLYFVKVFSSTSERSGRLIVQ